MDIDLVSEKDTFVDEEKSRQFLETDSICVECGAIINSYYEDSCLLCSCGGDKFISGKVSVDLRLLIDFHITDLKALCEIEGERMGNRAQMVIRLMIKRMRGKLPYGLNEKLVRKIILRNRHRFWYTRNIDLEVTRAKRGMKSIRFVREDEMERNGSDGKQ